MRVTAKYWLLTSGLLVSLLASTASAQDVRTGVEQLALQIVKGAPEGRQLRIAVADFPDLQGVTSDLGRYVASRLTTRLAQTPRFLVVERQRLGQVLGELKFSMSDLVDPAKAKQLGRMVGVEAIVVGTIADLGNQVDLDARVIEIETNRMLLGATTTISRDQVVDEMLKRGRQEASSAGSPQPQGSAPPAPATPSAPGLTVGGFRLEPAPCERSGGKLACPLLFTNLGRDERKLSFTESAMIDEKGNRHSAYPFIGQQGVGLGHAFMPQLPVRVHFVAERVRPDAKRINLVIGIHGFGSTPVLREIPIEP